MTRDRLKRIQEEVQHGLAMLKGQGGPKKAKFCAMYPTARWALFRATNSLSAMRRVALGRDWSDMDSAKPYLTWSQLNTDKCNRVELTRFWTKMQETGGLNGIQTQGVNSMNLSFTTIAMVEQRWFTSVSQGAEDQVHQSAMASQAVPSTNLQPLSQ
ncbi:hypothetical protein CR513_36788, partial [Mucuna pruriens]